MPETQPLPSGHLLQQYRVEETLGVGGFGVTYLATDVHLDKKVVIKENFPSAISARGEDGGVTATEDNEEVFAALLKNFLKEARILASFEHPNIVPVNSYFEDKGTAYLVMPFLDGRSLKTLAQDRGEQRLSREECISIIEPLLDALDTLHEGRRGRGSSRNTDEQRAVYHRDIKPDNILIVEEADGAWTPVLIDFGSARDFKTYSATTEYQQTVKYKSGAFTPPEFTENDRRSIGPSSDLFSIGATIYSCITRDPLHDRSMMDDQRGDEQMVENYGEEFLGLIMDATELSVRDRPQTTDDWRERLALVQSGDRAVIAPVSNERPPRKRWSLVAVALILVASCLLWMFANRDRGSVDLEGKREAGTEQEFAGIKFQWCPPGRFVMGSPQTQKERAEGETLHDVTITRGFWLAKFECTQAQWYAVMGANPSRFDGEQRPVESLSWNDTREYFARLNSSGELPEGWKMRLPTEAEWEYACRAGTQTVFSGGDVLTGNDANCNGEVPYGTDQPGPFLNETAEVGSYRANAWGLHDMHGNVEEYCADWYAPLAEVPASDPQGPTIGFAKIGRGGHWGQPGEGCRAAKRGAYQLWSVHGGAGFRVALVPITGETPTLQKREVGPEETVSADHPLAGKTFHIKNSAGLLLDADQDSLGKQGSKVHLWSPAANGAVELNQRWKFSAALHMPHGYTIINLDPESENMNFLDGENTKQSGGLISLKKDNDNLSGQGGYVQNQCWKVKPTGSGRFILINTMQGFVLACDPATKSQRGGGISLRWLKDSQPEDSEWVLEEVD